MLAARLVGPTGTVIGVERDAGTLTKARERVAEAGLDNVTFVETDVAQLAGVEPLDAVVGRLILEFLPDPGAVVRSLSTLLRPGGIVAFHDACWGPLLQLTAHLPLRAKCVGLIHRAFQRSGANMDMELVLYRAFQEAGLPAPSMRIEVPVGESPDIARWVYDLFCSLRPRMPEHDLTAAALGDLASLRARLDAEMPGRRPSAPASGSSAPGPESRDRNRDACHFKPPSVSLPAGPSPPGPRRPSDPKWPLPGTKFTSIRMPSGSSNRTE